MALSTIFVDYNRSKHGDGVPKFQLPTSFDDANLVQYLTDSKAFLVDASIQETYSHEAEITDNNVEKGLSVNDHYNPKPVVITMQLLHSEYPIGLDSLAKGTITGAGQLAGQQIFQRVGLGSLGREAGGVAYSAQSLIRQSMAKKDPKKSAQTRVQSTYELFETFIQKKVILSVVTGLKEYKNLMIKTMTVNRDRSTGASLSFTVVLQQVRIIESSTIKLPKTKIKKDGDRQTAKENKGDTSEKPVSKSTLKAIKDQLGSTNLYDSFSSSSLGHWLLGG